jgi:predicted  nucleic acid-binding Zn-ribbon protein
MEGEVNTTPEVSSTPVESVQSSAPEAPVQTSAPESAQSEWTPNYKVKAYDNEYEIPENFRSYINQENEKNFKEVFERSFAFDTIKQKYKDAHTKYQDVNGRYETVSKNLDKLSKYVQNNDFDSFFKSINIPEQTIQQWIYNKLQVQDLPQEQQQLYTKNSEYQRQLLSMQEQYEEMQSKLGEFESYKQQQALQQRVSELDSAINSSEYKSIAEAYDARVGQPGAFKNEVILRAAAVANATGKDLSPAEAVQELAKLVAWNSQNGGQVGGVAQKANGRPTIPSVSGKASSPVAPQVKSIEDLKKLAKAAAQGQTY